MTVEQEWERCIVTLMNDAALTRDEAEAELRAEREAKILQRIQEANK